MEHHAGMGHSCMHVLLTTPATLSLICWGACAGSLPAAYSNWTRPVLFKVSGNLLTGEAARAAQHSVHDWCFGVYADQQPSAQ